MLSRSALYPQRSHTAYFVVTNSHLLSLPQFDFSSALRLNLANVIWQADSTVSQLKAISEQLASAKHLGVLQVSLPANVQTEIEQIGEILNSSIAAITNSSNDIRDDLNSVRVALITVSILMLTSLQFLVSFLQFLGYISLTTRTMTLECSLCTFYK